MELTFAHLRQRGDARSRCGSVRAVEPSRAAACCYWRRGGRGQSAENCLRVRCQNFFVCRLSENFMCSNAWYGRYVLAPYIDCRFGSDVCILICVHMGCVGCQKVLCILLHGTVCDFSHFPTLTAALGLVCVRIYINVCPCPLWVLYMYVYIYMSVGS